MDTLTNPPLQRMDTTKRVFRGRSLPLTRQPEKERALLDSHILIGAGDGINGRFART